MGRGRESSSKPGVWPGGFISLAGRAPAEPAGRPELLAVILPVDHPELCETDEHLVELVMEIFQDPRHAFFEQRGRDE